LFPAILSDEHPKSILKYSAPHPSSGSGDEEDESEIDSRSAGFLHVTVSALKCQGEHVATKRNQGWLRFKSRAARLV